MQLFYSPTINENILEFAFDKNESRHIVRVLRKKEGDTLFITNGLGKNFNAEIIIANDKKCLVKIVKIEVKPKPWKYYLHVAIAPTKLNNRFEWFLEKATEIGIDEITPIICENSERKAVKLERLKKIVHSAAKQSLKFQFPKLNSPITFNTLIQQNFEGQKFIAHCEDSKKQNLKNNLQAAEKITILIGPEGDFSTNEIRQSLEHNFIPVSLGKSRLRTETAGVVAVHSVAFFNE